VLLLAFSDAILTFKTFQNARARGAVCNDGSPAGFYYTLGSGSGVDTWVIHQQGGWQCWDTASCQERLLWANFYTSSRFNAPTITFDGILSTNGSLNPTFFNANLVYIPYCSSDTFSGNRDPNGTIGIDGWYFKGKPIINAVAEDLVGMGMNNSKTQILFTGCSAGGNAVYVNVDYFRSVLPFTPLKYLGFSDADIDFNSIPPAVQYMNGMKLWQGRANEVCASAYSATPYMCYFGSTSTPYIKTPVFTHIEQYDNMQYMYKCVCNFNSSDPTMLAQMGELRYSIKSSLVVVKPPHVVYSPACAYHCTSLNSEFNSISIGGVTLASYLAKFWQQGGGGGTVGNLIDECTGFNCSPNCPAI
jgi:hypothetical protein